MFYSHHNIAYRKQCFVLAGNFIDVGLCTIMYYEMLAKNFFGCATEWLLLDFNYQLDLNIISWKN